MERSPDGEPALRVDPAPELLLPGAGEYRAELWGEHGDDRGDDDARGVPVVAVIAAGPGRRAAAAGRGPACGNGAGTRPLPRAAALTPRLCNAPRVWYN